MFGDFGTVVALPSEVFNPELHVARDSAEGIVVAVLCADELLDGGLEFFGPLGEGDEEVADGFYPFLSLVALGAEEGVGVGGVVAQEGGGEVGVGAVAKGAEFAYFLEHDAVHAVAEVFIE